MKLSQQIKDIIETNNSSTSAVAIQLGQSHSNLLNKLSRDNLRINELEEIVIALGYTDIEIVLRGNKQDAVIKSDSVSYKEHNVYMMFNENQSLIDDIHDNGFRNKKFKDLVFELLEPHLKAKIGDMWDVSVPKDFEEGFKQVVSNQLSIDDFILKLYGGTSKKD